MKKSMRWGRLMVALAFACAWALPAAELGSPEACRYGVRLLTASPRQDFRGITGRTGLGVGVFADAELGAGTVLETRVDFLDYPQTNQPKAAPIAAYTVHNPISLVANSVAVGLDLRHALPFDGMRRFYALGGLMAIRYEFGSSGAGNLVDANGIPLPGITRRKDRTSVKMGLALGLGVEITGNLALTGRYTTVNIDGTTFATLETGLSYRF
jgi:opacity protein-like surface antigen